MLQLSLDFLGRQLDRLKPARLPQARRDRRVNWKHGITVHLVFRPKARRYLLRLQPDGTARLVIPRRGSEAEALRFLERSEGWLLKRRAQWEGRHQARQAWTDGARFLFRGEEVGLSVEDAGGTPVLRFADQ